MGSFTEPWGDDVLDCVVVGAGVVGLAVARALALAGREVVVLEAAEAIGTETSSRNSEVIHAGLYYPQGSLKARLCVSGRQMLYDYCGRHGIAHQRCGKLIVATDPTQLPVLEQIRAKAAANGVDDLVPIDAAEARGMEPALSCVGALKSPSSGIIDSHALMLALQGEAQHHGASFLMGSRVCSAQALSAGSAGLGIEVADRSGRTRWRARTLVNCAGLMAPALAASINGLGPDHVPRAHYAKGHYFTLSGRCPFSRLIYPVPEPGGLGVHLTLDLQGRGRFGPDVQWIDEINYDVDAERAQAFYGEVRRYWPGLEDGALQPAYAGIRPKIAGPATPSLDFRIDGPATHGVAGLVNLFGIESPGLTASLAIGQWVCDLLREADPVSNASSAPTMACLT